MRSLLAAALLLAACTGARPTPSAPAPVAEPAFDPAQARADVAWLADPARTGRGIGTPGGPAAEAWIADRMRALGLAPAGTEGYRQPFEAPFRATLGEGNALTVGGARPELGKGWLPSGFSDDGTVAGELVFAGYGITAPDLGYDDYAGLDVKGKVVLVAGDFPREADAAVAFRDPKNYAHGEWRTKATNARDHGAAAVLLVRDAWQHEGPDELPRWTGATSSRGGVVVARVTSAALLAGGVDVAALAREIDADLKPRSRALGVQVSLTVRVNHEKATTANLLGLVPGSDPAVAGECVVVGAHHDHLGYGGETSLAPEQLGQVHPGGDDNASGVAAMLEVARAVKAGPPPRRTVLFVAFAGEESGLLGSSQVVKSPPPACAVERMQLMVNIDMVGRARSNKLLVHGVDTAKGLRELVPAVAERPPRVPLTLSLSGDGYSPSDNTSFYAKGVPVLYFFTGAHLDYHRPSDTADKVDPESVAEVARLAWRLALEAADAPARWEVVRTAAPQAPQGRGRSGASLGTIPDFTERTEPGLLISGVRPGSPAEAAGLKAGDVVLRIGATTIKGLPDVSTALGMHRPGDVVEVEWQRDGATQVAKVKLGERK